MRKATITAFDASKTLSKSSFEHDDISGKKKKKNLINLNGEDWPQISSPY